VGCGYKFLNGGPGAPAFAWVRPALIDRCVQPLSGWLGHAAPFDFAADYRPAPGIARMICGTPPVLSLAALECGVDTLLAAEPLGGMTALRAKSLALTRLFMDRVADRCAGHGLLLASPDADAQRGSQVSLVFDPTSDAFGAAYAVVQALIERGVVGDFRAGSPVGSAQDRADILRFGVAPLYTRFVDVWDAVERLGAVLAGGEWRQARHKLRAGVT